MNDGKCHRCGRHLDSMEVEWESHTLKFCHTDESLQLKRGIGSVCLICIKKILADQKKLLDHFKSNRNPKQKFQNSNGSFSTILHRVCEVPWGQESFIRELLAAGARIYNNDNVWSNPFYAAVGADSPITLTLLHEFGAMVNPPMTYIYKRTPLHMAAARGRLKSLEWLAAHGADLDAADYNGRTALHLAAGGGDPQALEILLSHGAAINPLDNNGISPLRAAAKKAKPANLAVLLEHGAADTLDSSQWNNLLGMAATMRRYAGENYQTNKSWNPEQAESYYLPLIKIRQAVLDLLRQRRAISGN